VFAARGAWHAAPVADDVYGLIRAARPRAMTPLDLARRRCDRHC
jgi:hypothetical protein